MKNLIKGITALLILVSLQSCNKDSNKENSHGNLAITETAESKVELSQKTVYPLTMETFGQSVTIEKVPEKVVVFQYNVAEVLAALNIADKIIALREDNNGITDVLPQYKKALESVPKPEVVNAGGAIPTLESMLTVGGDILLLNSYFFNVPTFGSPADYLSQGINLYVMEGSYIPDCTIENSFNDIRNIGKIFNVEDRANALIDTLNIQRNDVMSRIKNTAKVPTVIFSGEVKGSPTIAGTSGLANDILEAAGGKNIFSDITKQYGRTTYEEIISRRPEVIVVIKDTGDNSGGEAKIALLKSKPELQEIPAIKNNRFIVVPLNAIFSGMQNVSALETIAMGLHPEAFK